MKFIAKTLYGLENVLAGELAGLGASSITTANRAVMFSGSLRMMYAANYMLRTAVSVLHPVAEFRIFSADDLYKKSLDTEWDSYMNSDDTFSIVPVVNSNFFNHTGYAALRLKDAIADYFRNKTGRRPSVDNDNPGLIINCHISNNLVTLSLDSSLMPLFKRGYRTVASEAPLNETLAAGMILLSGWDGKRNLYDPMCGSGTILIEAAMIACRIPPGKFRKFFGFQKWKNFDPLLFDEVRAGFDSGITALPDIEIAGSDISPDAVRGALVNAGNAGLEGIIKIEEKDFLGFTPPGGNGGYIFINPPYGQRLMTGETDSLYKMIGTVLKHNCQGYSAWIISPNTDSLKQIGLKPSRKHNLFNGSLECRFMNYELYEGTKKKKNDM